jgi:beta-glucanase (GH16 family)
VSLREQSVFAAQRELAINWLKSAASEADTLNVEIRGTRPAAGDMSKRSGPRRPEAGHKSRRTVGVAIVAAVALAGGAVTLLVPITGSAAGLGIRATPVNRTSAPVVAQPLLLTEHRSLGNAILTTTTAVPQTTTTTWTPFVAQPVGGVAGPWNLVFDSEFNGSKLPTWKWSTGWFGSGITTGVSSSEQECYDPSQVSVANGSLNFSAVARSEVCGGATRPYASGMVTTDGKFSFTYGYMEARIWLPAAGSIADWPAFWADGQNWPTTGEIDTVEGIGGKACAHFHNSAGGPGACATGNYASGWHTFAADWEPGSVTFDYDGTQIWKDTSGITSAPMYLILDLALSSAITSPDTAPAAMRVDYVRVWQH